MMTWYKRLSAFYVMECLTYGGHAMFLTYGGHGVFLTSGGHVVFYLRAQ